MSKSNFFKHCLIITSCLGIINSLCAQSSPCLRQGSVAEVLEERNLTELQETRMQLLDCSKWQDSLALVDHALGIVYYGQDQLDSAIWFTQEAQTKWVEFNETEFTFPQGKSNFNLGYFLQERGNYLQAKPFFQQAALIYKTLDLPGRLQNTYRHLGQVLQNEGSFTEAAAYFRLALSTAATLDEPATLAKTYLDIGNLLWVEEHHAEALDTLQRALIFFEPLVEEEEDLAACQNQLALVYDELGQPEKAIYYYQQALQGFEDWDNCVRAALVANNLGDAYLENGRLAEARTVLEKGLRLAEGCEMPEIIAQSYDHLGELYLKEDKPEAACQAFEQAVQTILPAREGVARRQLIRYSPHKLDLLTYFSDLARAQKIIYQKEQDKSALEKARSIYELGDYLIDEIRQGHYDQATQLFWREKVLPFYEDAIECTYLLQDGEQAFVFFEKSQSVLLLEAVQGARLLSSISDSLRIVEQQLKNELRQAEKAFQETIANKQQQVEERFLQAQGQLQEFYSYLAETYPQFVDNKDLNELVAYEDFKEQFLSSTNTEMLHYFWGQQRVYALYLSTGQTAIVDLGTKDSIANALFIYLDFFRESQLIENAPQAFLQQSQQLYRMLIEPVLNTLPSQLMIIPSGPLAYLPFEALVSKRAGTIQLATADYLLRSSRVLYAYSATLYKHLKDRRRPSGQQSLLAIAPFTQAGRGAYPQLAYSEEEVTAISKYFNTNAVSDAQATRQYFLAQQQNYRMLHLSTHAFGYSPEQEPHIVFYDSLLRLSDLYQLSIPAEMVVLSACQTQTGQLARGEGVLGLGRGFIYAGTGSIVASLWNLNDRFSSQLVGAFYQGLAAEQPKPEALRQAKLAFLENPDIPQFQKSPYYWAGLTYYGDNEVLMITGSSRWWSISGLVVGVLLLSGLIIWWRKTKR